MSKITDKIISEEYIPLLIKETFPKIKNELKHWGEEDFTKFFITFELMVKKKRERLQIGEINSN